MTVTIPSKNESRPHVFTALDKKMIFILFLLSFSFRLLAGLYSGVNGVYMDEIIHLNMAQSLVTRGQWLTRGIPISKADFVYYLFIAPAVLIKNPYIARCVIVGINSFLMSITLIPYGYLVCRFLKTMRFRIIACLLFLFLPDLAISMQVMQESLFLPLVFTVFALFTAMEVGDLPVRFCGLEGVLLGALCLTKDSGYLIAGVVFLFLFLSKNSCVRLGTVKKAWQAFLLFIAFFACTYLGLAFLYFTVEARTKAVYTPEAVTAWDGWWEEKLAAKEQEELAMLSERGPDSLKDGEDPDSLTDGKKDGMSSGNRDGSYERDVAEGNAADRASAAVYTLGSKEWIRAKWDGLLDKLEYYWYLFFRMGVIFLNQDARNLYSLFSYMAITVLAGGLCPFFVGIAAKPNLEPGEHRLYQLVHACVGVVIFGTVLLSWHEMAMDYPAVRVMYRYLFFYTFLWQLFMLTGLERGMFKIRRLLLPLVLFILVAVFCYVIPADACHVDNLPLLYISKHFRGEAMYPWILTALLAYLGILVVLIFMAGRPSRGQASSGSVFRRLLTLYCLGTLFCLEILSTAYIYALSHTWKMTQMTVISDGEIISTYLQEVQAARRADLVQGLESGQELDSVQKSDLVQEPDFVQMSDSVQEPDPEEILHSKEVLHSEDVILLSEGSVSAACLEGYLNCQPIVVLERDLQPYLMNQSYPLPVNDRNIRMTYDCKAIGRCPGYIISRFPLEMIVEEEQMLEIGAEEVELGLEWYHLYALEQFPTPVIED